MKKPIIVFVIIIGFVFLFISCNAQHPVYSSTNSPDNSFSNPFSVPTELPSTETQKPLNPMVTRTVIPSSVKSIGTQVIPVELSGIPKCQYSSLRSVEKQSLQFDGEILFQNEIEKKYWLFDGITYDNTLPVVWNDDYHFYGFSPEGNVLVYSINSKKLILLSSEGKTREIEYDLSKLDTRKDQDLKVLGIRPGGWINDQIMYYTVEYNSAVGERMRPEKYQAILNLSTGKWEDFSDIIPGWNQNTFVYPSPDESRILYNGIVQSQLAAILWDVSQGKEIWYDLGREIFSSYFFDPDFLPLIFQWAPDSSKFAVLGYQNGNVVVRIFSKDGDILGLVPTGANDDNDLRVFQIKWAPGSHSLSIFIPNNNDLSYSATIYVYDLDSKKLKLQCTVSQDSAEWEWVSDKYLVYSSPKTGIAFIDVQSGILDNVGIGKLIGWSKKPFRTVRGTPSPTITPRIKTPEG